MNEEWRPVVGFEGMHSVSDKGRVRSENRVVLDKGRWSRRKGRLLKPQGNSKGYPRVWICGTQRFIHHLVAEAFIGPRPEGMLVLHKDDDRSNNGVANLYYGTYSQNMRDLMRNGNHHNVNKAHCIHGHEFTPENTLPNGKNGRGCRKCGRRRSREYMRRKAMERKNLQLNNN